MHTCVLSQLRKRVFIHHPASTANLDREIKQNDSAPASLELLLSDEVKLKLFADLFGLWCLHTAIFFLLSPFWQITLAGPSAVFCNFQAALGLSGRVFAPSALRLLLFGQTIP